MNALKINSVFGAELLGLIRNALTALVIFYFGRNILSGMKKDTIVCGILVALASIVLLAAVIAGFMLLLALPLVSNLKVFVLSFVAPVVLLRYYVKKLQYMSAAKGIALVLFVTMLPFIIILAKMGTIM